MATQQELEAARARLQQLRTGQTSGGTDLERAKARLLEMRNKQAPPETPPEAPQAPQQGVSGIGGFGLGVAKEAAGRPFSLARLGTDIGEKLAGTKIGGAIGQAIVKPFAKFVTPEQAKGAQEVIRKSAETPEFLRPRGGAEKAGAFAENIGEFFIPGGASTKVAGLAGKGLTKAPKLLQGLGKLGAKAGTEAALFGGQTAIQQGEVGPEAITAAKFGAAAPLIGRTLGKAGELSLSPFKPERLMGKALGFTKTQIRNLDKKISSTDAYKNVSDFALKQGFQGSRQEMSAQIGDRFAELTETKPEVLAQITTPIKNTFKEAFEYLKKTYKTPGQERVLSEIEKLSNKKNLSATELDRLRYLIDRSLPTGAYKGAEPVRVEGIQNLVDPMRRLLEKLDKTGSIKAVNQDIRILYDMLKAMEHSQSGNVGAQVLWRTMQRVIGAGGATSLGVPPVLTAPFVLTEIATDFPQVSSFLAQRFRGVQAKIPTNIPPAVRATLERFFGK